MSVWTLESGVELGAGGYGRVVRAWDQNGRKAACKVISTSRMKLTAIEKEIVLMQKLKHQNIVEFFGAEEKKEKKQILIFMELADRGELFSRVIEAGTLTEDQARPYFQQLMDAVDYMHKHKVVHRDLKLENVLLDEHDNCKVCDFGLAHAYKDQDKPDDRSSYLSEICGSKSYCAPEVLRGTGYEGFPTDVWSCGICLFAMLAGFFPLDEASGSDWRFERVKMASSSHLSATHTIFGFYDRPCLLSQEVTDLIDSMLVIDPKDRLKVHHAIAAPWCQGKKQANYRAAVDLKATNAKDAAAQIAAMYEQEGDAAPVYRSLTKAAVGGLDPVPDGASAPKLMKQKQMFRDQYCDGEE